MGMWSGGHETSADMDGGRDDRRTDRDSVQR